MSNPEEAISEEDLAPGTQVGEYVVGDKLGEGAFGKVFRAAHPLIGKQAAIKVLSRRYAADPQVVSRFISEARAVNQIAHRNIIDIFSFGRLPDGRHYFIMELLEGRPLDRLLAERGRLTMEETLPILRGLARALDAAHAKGIVHRDLKPANVFICQDGDGLVAPKLLDFGIAKLFAEERPIEHKTRTGAPIGTPYFMSPEQCQGGAIDHRTDVYSFGVLCFQLLTGQLPFAGEHYVEILLKHIQQAPPSPSASCPEVPPAVDAPILAMMAKDPNQRPRSLAAAVQAMEEAARAAGISVPLSLSGSGSGPRLLPAALSEGPLEAAMSQPGLASTFLSQRESVDALPPAPRRWLPLGVVAGLALVASLGALVYRQSQAPSVAVHTRPGEIQPEVTPARPAEELRPAEPALVSPPLAPPRRVKLRFEGTPKGAFVLDGDGQALGRLPFDIEREAGAGELIVRIEAPGHQPQNTSMSLARDGTARVTLEPAASKPVRKKAPARPRGGPKKPSRDDIEEAF